MIYTSEPIHSGRMGLKSCSLMLLDNMGMCIYRKKKMDASSTQQICALRCHRLHMNQQEEQEGMMPGGHRDLIINTVSAATEQLALHPLPALKSFEFHSRSNHKVLYNYFKPSKYTTHQQLQL